MLNRRGFLGRFLGATLGSAVACKVEMATEAEAKELAKSTEMVTCLDLRPNGWFVSEVRPRVINNHIYAQSRDWPMPIQLPGLIETELDVTFCGPGVIKLSEYFFELMGRQ